ncbi:dynein regulator [Fomes fomentarius]|nr:dynein regulator [Fomes fomentarius]
MMVSVPHERRSHKAVLSYLLDTDLQKTAGSLKEEVPELANFEQDPSSPVNGLLVKKWTSVIRMQKKIMDLESRLAQATEELSRGTSDGTKRASKDWIPSAHPLRSLIGHRDKIYAVRFHPHYTVLASASVDATVKIWDWETGELERTLKAHTRAVTDCDFDSSGKLLATASNDLFIKLWNVHEEYKNFATLRGHEHTISSVRFLPDDASLVSAGRDHTVRVWSVATTHCVKVLRPHEDWIRSLVPSFDGRLLLTASSDHTARITELESSTLKVEMRGHENTVECAAFVPLAAAPSIRELISQPATSQTSKVDALGLSFVVTGSRDKTIKLWDALRGQCLWTFNGHDGWVQGLAFHPSGLYMFSVADDHTMRIWDLKTGRCKRQIEANSPFTQCLAIAYTPANRDQEEPMINAIATGGTDQLVKIWRP